MAFPAPTLLAFLLTVAATLRIVHANSSGEGPACHVAGPEFCQQDCPDNTTARPWASIGTDGVMRPCCHCSEQRAQVGHTRNGTVEHDLAATAASHARAAADWRVRGLSHSMTEARLDVARGVMRRVLVVGC